MTHIIEIFLPLRDNDGLSFPDATYELEKKLLLEKFGGVTVYMRAPAQGLWAKDGDITVDTIVIFEIMTDDIDTEWWQTHRLKLQDTFAQEQILIRATSATLL